MMPATPFRAVSDGVLVSVRLAPKSSANQIGGIESDADGSAILKVGVTAAPEAGKANAALIKLLAKAWKLPKTSLSVVSGATSRRKVVLVSGPPDALIARLKEWGRTVS
ncbi:MAG: DUF167 family protein [Alphaproteobacteria bacterium]|nr:DUF167 family protein [Alphaproteobacteria bacterium]